MSDSQEFASNQEWLDCLHENGYRLTAPRQAVVDVIASSPRLLTPLEVYELARERHPKLGLVTVYRTVEKLEELGLIQRVHQPSGCQAFIATAPGHQHLLICQNCGRVEYFSGDREKMDDLIAEVGHDSGFQIKDHWLQLFGVCSECRQN
ncbi:MAG: Fur family transcriptional regulator [Anaerolineales bacterium]